jgi:hypothetical protein
LEREFVSRSHSLKKKRTTAAETFSPDEDVYANALLLKNLLRACPTLLWEGERAGKRLAVGWEVTRMNHRRNRGVIPTGRLQLPRGPKRWRRFPKLHD